MPSTHRKRRKSYNDPGHAHFLTFSCYRRLPLLNTDRSRRWVIDAMDAARRDLHLAIWAYVIMPEHLHVLLYPRSEPYDMADILTALKRPVSDAAKRHLIDTGQADWLDRLTVRRGERVEFRFWQRGGGFDSNLWSDKPILDAIQYIHNDPVRRGLVDRAIDWDWSSARWWETRHPGPLRVDELER